MDDFIVLGRTIEECQHSLVMLEQTAGDLGLVMEPSKREGPSPSLTFLGIEVDTQLMEIRLPLEKLQDLKLLLARWLGKKHCVKRELESLTGKLQHACKVVRLGRCFMRRFYALIPVGNHSLSLLRLNRDLQDDIWWWHTWVEQWNGVSILWNTQRFQPDHHVWSDASGSWGCGAVWEARWFQLEWAISLKESLAEATNDDSIAVRELIPVAVAAAVWGPQWQGEVVMFHSDNKAVVAALNRLYSKNEAMMQLLRCVVFYAARAAFRFQAMHVPGKENTLADHLSRNSLTAFFSSCPQASLQTQTPVPDHVRETVAGEDPPNWRSANWTRRFGGFLGRP